MWAELIAVGGVNLFSGSKSNLAGHADSYSGVEELLYLQDGRHERCDLVFRSKRKAECNLREKTVSLTTKRMGAVESREIS